jgi:hypothetical protein
MLKSKLNVTTLDADQKRNIGTYIALRFVSKELLAYKRMHGWTHLCSFLAKKCE